MGRPLNRLWLGAALGLAVAACDNSSGAGTAAPDESAAKPEGPALGSPKLGLMTSLPLYWPPDADMAEIASGEADSPWQRQVIERRYELVPLDTLSPIPGLSPDDPETDPLAELDYLAVIQPRGLSAADNVALDDWVRAGGNLMLVLDPQLTGEYELPVGDPRRPVDVALVWPIVERWGLEMGYRLYETWEAGLFDVPFGTGSFTVAHPGEFEIVDPNAAECTLLAKSTIAECKVGEGTAFLLADAALFEDREFAGQDGAKLLSLLDAAFLRGSSGKSREKSGSAVQADVN